MGDRFVRASLLDQSKHEVGLYFAITGSNVERHLKLIDRLVQMTAVTEAFPKSVMRHKIARSHGEGVPPERLTIAPVGSLDVSAPCQCNHGDGSRRGQNSALKRGS